MSSQPVSCKHGGDHVLVPFAMEDGGTLGAHAHTLLKTLADEHAVSAGRYSSLDSRSPLSPPRMQVSLWMQRWQNRLSTWLMHLSQKILRLYRPKGILSASLYCSLHA